MVCTWSSGAAGAQVPYKHKVGGSNPSSTTTFALTTGACGLPFPLVWGKLLAAVHSLGGASFAVLADALFTCSGLRVPSAMASWWRLADALRALLVDAGGASGAFS